MLLLLQQAFRFASTSSSSMYMWANPTKCGPNAPHSATIRNLVAYQRERALVGRLPLQQQRSPHHAFRQMRVASC